MEKSAHGISRSLLVAAFILLSPPLSVAEYDRLFEHQGVEIYYDTAVRGSQWNTGMIIKYKNNNSYDVEFESEILLTCNPRFGSRNISVPHKLILQAKQSKEIEITTMKGCFGNELENITARMSVRKR